MSSRLSQNFASVENTYSGLLDSGSQLNGRIDLITNMPQFNIDSYKTRPVDNTTYSKEALHGQMTTNPLSELFFSSENIEILQQGIRYRVYVESNQKYTIGRQSDSELKIVMRSIYLQYAKNQISDYIAQARELNSRVIDSCVPEILSNLYQHEVYRRDVSSLPVPMERSPLITTKGTKVLEMKSFM
jgi:hypothetical protein